jgi:hypothetical protein
MLEVRADEMWSTAARLRLAAAAARRPVLVGCCGAA